MPYDVNPDIFPNNAVHYIALAMGKIAPNEIAVLKRTLRNEDPMMSIGVFAQTWDPKVDSLEMRGAPLIAPQRPPIQTYGLGVQAFVKDTEEERGLATHATLAHDVRTVLYTDPDLQVVLAGLQVSLADGSIESVKRWGIVTANYYSGEIRSEMLYLSTLQCWIETETRRP